MASGQKYSSTKQKHNMEKKLCRITQLAQKQILNVIHTFKAKWTVPSCTKSNSWQRLFFWFQNCLWRSNTFEHEREQLKGTTPQILYVSKVSLTQVDMMSREVLRWYFWGIFLPFLDQIFLCFYQCSFFAKHFCPTNVSMHCHIIPEAFSEGFKISKLSWEKKKNGSRRWWCLTALT